MNPDTVGQSPGTAISPESPHLDHLRTRQLVLTLGKYVGAGYTAISALLIGVGLVVVHPLRHSAIVRWDESSVRWFADHRSKTLTSASALWSRVGDGPSIVAVGLVVAIALIVHHRAKWAAYLAAALAVELGTFLTISYAVGRKRPAVPHLGSVPSTGSFPSGHIAATIVLYGSITLLAVKLNLPLFVRGALAIVTVIVSLSVGWARMYRGMHHPIDVGAGAAMGIGLVITFMLAVRAAERPSPNSHHHKDHHAV